MSGETESKDLIKEYYILPVHRAAACHLFRRFVEAAGAKSIEAQTNDTLLTMMLFDCAVGLKSETILFRDAHTTNLSIKSVTFRRVADSDRDRIFPHKLEGVGDWLLEADGEIVATGGVYLHYNLPYGDISMEVNERLPPPWVRELPGSGIEANELRNGQNPRGTMQRRQCGFAGDVAEGGVSAVRTDRTRGNFGVTRGCEAGSLRYARRKSMGLFNRIFGGGTKRLPYPAGLQTQVEKAMNGLRSLTAAHDGMWQISQAAWSVNQDEGLITFDSPTGIRATAPVQVVGSYDTQDSTWLWGWDNPSLEEPLTQHARKVQAYGHEQGIEIFTKPKFVCPEDQCWELAAFACMLCEAQGVYRGPAGTARVFMTFGSVSLGKRS